MAIYEIWADEAWTHCGLPLNRYWCFFGGIMGPQSDLERLDIELSKVKSAFNIQGEVAWGNVRGRNLNGYRAFVDCALDLIQRTDLRFRQVFLDRSLIRLNEQGTITPIADLDLQYRIYYQFLKHAFGLRFLPPAKGPGPDRVLIRLDDHSSQRHKRDLETFVTGLPGTLGRRDLDVEVTFRDSAKSCRLQACDLLIGAAGSHGNKAHLRRAPNQRGKTPKQQVRYEMAKYVYNKLRALDASERGSAAFNWFESTGLSGQIRNLFDYKLRIWKFKPALYHIDKGWQNDHLDKQGRYQAADITILPSPQPDLDETF